MTARYGFIFVLIFGVFVNMICRLVTKWRKGIFLFGLLCFSLCIGKQVSRLLPSREQILFIKTHQQNTIMKKIVLVLIVALMGTLVTNAQPPKRQGAHRGHSVEQRVARLEKALDLTAEQKAEITKIYTQEMESMSKNRPADVEPGKEQDQAARKARHEQMRAQREATDAKITSLLTPEQATKFAELKERQGQRHHGPKHDGQRGKDRKAPRLAGGGCDCSCKSN